VRLDGGWWFDSAHLLGMDLGGFVLSQVGTTRSYVSDVNGSPILGRPFIDTGGTAQTYLVSFPGFATGGVNLSSTSQLSGGEINLLAGVLHDQILSFTALGGFRFLNLYENMQIQQFSQASNPLTFNNITLFPGSQVFVNDSFRTSNQFYGGQIGGRLQSQLGLWTFGLDAKLGMGATVQTIKINGSTVVRDSQGDTLALPGGLLALPSNMGSFTSSAFSLVPEVGLNVGVKLGQNVELRIGYSFLYWTNVVRPPGQLDPVVNPNLLPASPLYAPGTGGLNRPGVLFHNEDFWAQGFNFTIVISF